VAVPAALGVSFAVPLVGCEPVQPPLAAQVVAFVDDQVSVLLAPAVMLVGFAVSVTVGVLFWLWDPQASGKQQRIPTATPSTSCLIAKVQTFA